MSRGSGWELESPRPDWTCWRPIAAPGNLGPFYIVLAMTEQKDHWWNGLWPFLIPGVYFLVGLWGYYVSSPG
jgi:hypothetical protein